MSSRRKRSASVADVNYNLIVGSARSDENGKASGGKAGDQTYKEVSFQQFYYHDKGWICIRAKDPTVAQRIAQTMIEACENDNIGYSQGYHGSTRKLAKKYGSYDAIAEPCSDDCSGLVGGCVWQATGIDVFDSGNMYTGNEVSKLKATGMFDVYETVNSSTPLYDGDILVTKTQGHTVVVVLGRPRTKDVPQQAKTTTYEATGQLYIRKGPGMEYDTVGVLKVGEHVEVDRIENVKWAHHSRGYSSTRYLKQV